MIISKIRSTILLQCVKVKFCVQNSESLQRKLENFLFWNWEFSIGNLLLTRNLKEEKKIIKSCWYDFKSTSTVNLVSLTSNKQSFCCFCCGSVVFLILLHITTEIGVGCTKEMFLPAFSPNIKIMCLDLKCVNHLLCAEFSLYLCCMNHRSFLLSNCVLSHTLISVEISWPIFLSTKIRQVETQLA